MLPHELQQRVRRPIDDHVPGVVSARLQTFLRNSDSNRVHMTLGLLCDDALAVIIVGVRPAPMFFNYGTEVV